MTTLPRAVQQSDVARLQRILEHTRRHQTTAILLLESTNGAHLHFDGGLSEKAAKVGNHTLHLERFGFPKDRLYPGIVTYEGPKPVQTSVTFYINRPYDEAELAAAMARVWDSVAKTQDTTAQEVRSVIRNIEKLHTYGGAATAISEIISPSSRRAYQEIRQIWERAGNGPYAAFARTKGLLLEECTAAAANSVLEARGIEARCERNVVIPRMGNGAVVRRDRNAFETDLLVMLEEWEIYRFLTGFDDPGSQVYIAPECGGPEEAEDGDTAAQLSSAQWQGPPQQVRRPHLVDEPERRAQQPPLPRHGPRTRRRGP